MKFIAKSAIYKGLIYKELRLHESTYFQLHGETEKLCKGSSRKEALMNKQIGSMMVNDEI